MYDVVLQLLLYHVILQWLLLSAKQIFLLKYKL